MSEGNDRSQAIAASSRTAGRPRALVTGAAGAIGSAVARRLVEKGAAVAGHDLKRPVVELDCVLQGDLVTEEPREVVRDAASSLGGLDLLVHCVGGAAPTSFLEISDEEWRAVLDLNLFTAFAVSQAAARTMLAAGGGTIVLFGSLTGRQGWDEHAHYCAAKAGIDALARSIAIELGGRGIRCNSVVPGTIDSPMTDHTGLSAEQLARLQQRTPVGRMGTPAEIAEIVVWLAEAPAFLNGESVVVDGGYSIEGTP